MKNSILTKSISYKDFKKEILNDYRNIVISREASLLGRKEVLSGKAKFGIFGDGKELPQIAMAKVFDKGDFRSGYYRDQTFMFAINKLTVKQFFSGLYANTSFEEEPMSGGRQMGSHFSSVFVDNKGDFVDLTNQYNISSDISPTSGQMPRLLGLAMASKHFRSGKFNSNKLSNNGNEIAWGTIGNASTSEGLFFETVNAIGVHQVPAVISIWDDDYGISVDNSYQTTKSSISEALKGFQRTKTEKGFEILTVNGWDYPSLISTYEHANNIARNEHVPVIIHVTELTQPVGHSTSGSHERYKSKDRLEWEKSYDCNIKMKEWILENGLFTSKELDKVYDIWGVILAEGGLQLAPKELFKPETAAYLDRYTETFSHINLSMDEKFVERFRLRKVWSNFLNEYQVCIGPTWCNLPWQIDTDLDPKLGDDALKKSFYFIAPANGLGLPAVALATGVSDGIPTGIQIYADLFRDDLALLAAEIIEKEKPCPSPINPM